MRKKENKTERIVVRVTPEFKKKIDAKAKCLCLYTSEYVSDMLKYGKINFIDKGADLAGVMYDMQEAMKKYKVNSKNVKKINAISEALVESLNQRMES